MFSRPGCGEGSSEEERNGLLFSLVVVVAVVVESYEGCLSACFLMHHGEEVFQTGSAAGKRM